MARSVDVRRATVRLAALRGIYPHALPAMQQDAVAKLAVLLHG